MRHRESVKNIINNIVYENNFNTNFKKENKCSHKGCAWLSVFYFLCDMKLEFYKQKLMTLFHFPIVLLSCHSSYLYVF